MSTQLKVHILWHLHQPIYAMANSNHFILPWVRLHAIKAYYDMAKSALDFPEMGMTLNLTPSLLLQLELYGQPGTTDHYLNLTLKEPDSLSVEEKQFIVDKFFQCSWDTMIHPYPRYKELLQKKMDRSINSFSNQDIQDLQVWFNLAWFGFFAKKEMPELQGLIKKNKNFTQAEKESLIHIQKKILSQIIPLFQKIDQEMPDMEIATTPFYHPILPLVYNTETARRCMPQWPMPEPFSYPKDAGKQIDMAIEKYVSLFSHKPAGFWPAEGSVSPEVAQLFLEKGIQWIATDEEVLLNTIKSQDHKEIFQPYCFQDKLRLFFRDKGISDAIGFRYSKMSTKDAIQDFMSNLANIAKSNDNDHISVILDGENPWEYYSDGGQSFLYSLYSELIQHPQLLPMSMVKGASESESKNLSDLYSASWIMGNFQIWIGNPEDNKAWEYLGKTRKKIAEKNTTLSAEKIQKALDYIYVAEGSDWFWWYGDDFQSDSKGDFDTLFRSYLMSAWEAIEEQIPNWLYEPIVEEKVKEEQFNPKEFIAPTIDGELTSFYEWHGSVRYLSDINASAIYNSQNQIKEIRYGFDFENFYAMIDMAEDTEESFEIKIHFIRQSDQEVKSNETGSNEKQSNTLAKKSFHFIFDQQKIVSPKTHFCNIAKKDFIEIKIPFQEFQAGPNQYWEFFVELLKDNKTIEKQPLTHLLYFTTPSKEFTMKHWFV